MENNNNGRECFRRYQKHRRQKDLLYLQIFWLEQAKNQGYGPAIVVWKRKTNKNNF